MYMSAVLFCVRPSCAQVAQLAGYVSEHSAYHHGEASLQGTIVGLAQDFVGSNNLNLLYPSGQFGTRLQGGKDAASARQAAAAAAQLQPECLTACYRCNGIVMQHAWIFRVLRCTPQQRAACLDWLEGHAGWFCTSSLLTLLVGLLLLPAVLCWRQVHLHAPGWPDAARVQQVGRQAAHLPQRGGAEHRARVVSDSDKRVIFLAAVKKYMESGGQHSTACSARASARELMLYGMPAAATPHRHLRLNPTGVYACNHICAMQVHAHPAHGAGQISTT
jgi:hypothetical protein